MENRLTRRNSSGNVKEKKKLKLESLRRNSVRDHVASGSLLDEEKCKGKGKFLFEGD